MNRSQALKQIAEAAKFLFGDIASENDKCKFKRKINYETVLGSYADSGGYIHGNMTPMNDYDTVSVINVLRNFNDFDLETNEFQTEKENYYTEKWNI